MIALILHWFCHASVCRYTYVSSESPTVFAYYTIIQQKFTGFSETKPLIFDSWFPERINPAVLKAAVKAGLGNIVSTKRISHEKTNTYM